MTKKIVIEFPNEAVAKEFVSFVGGTGDNTFYEFLETRENSEMLGHFQPTYGNIESPIVYKLSE